MKRKTIYSDFTFWLLIAANAYLIFYYIKFPDSINDIFLIFWMQSVLIGVFNFLDMLTLKNFSTNSNFKIGNKPVVAKDFKNNGCAAMFFAVHYGIFHLVYFFFLATLIDIKKVDWIFIELSFFVILAACLSNFIQNKIRNRTEDVNIGVMFFIPYARVIPMHLAILAPRFLNISAPVLFLVLKTFADVIMYAVSQNIVFKSRPADGSINN